MVNLREYVVKEKFLKVYEVFNFLFKNIFKFLIYFVVSFDFIYKGIFLF